MFSQSNLKPSDSEVVLKMSTLPKGMTLKKFNELPTTKAIGESISVL
jgi:hypothetical protein